MLSSEYRGCPCCSTCCEEPEPFHPEHDCIEDETVCEECYLTECHSCGRRCHCEI